MLSWRVLILPYIEGEDLFRKLRLNEPWDSPHNIELLSQMPRTFKPQSRKKTPQSFTTHYRVFYGNGAAFDLDRGYSFKDFRRGLANTILVTEGADAVSWTKPEELPFDPIGALPALGGVWKDEFRSVMADDSVVRCRNRSMKRPSAPKSRGRDVVARAR